MPITKPTLPPRSGYVEVEHNGHRTYKNILTGQLIENESAYPNTPQPHTEYYTYTGTDTTPITLTFTSKPLYITINNDLISSDDYQLNGNTATIDSADYNKIGAEYQVFAMCE